MIKAPIKNFKMEKYPNGSITQWFAENPSLYAQFNMDGHNGIDIVAPHGEPMYAVEDGEVINVNLSDAGHGRHLRFISDDRDSDGRNRIWVYGHCHVVAVKVGDKVKAGDLVAYMGNTGFVVSGATPYWKVNPYAGTHLHLGCRLARKSTRGWSYKGSDIKIKIEDYGNGYKGAVDPYPQLMNLSKKEIEYRGLQLTVISLLRTLAKLVL